MINFTTIIRVETEVKNGVLNIRRTFDFSVAEEAEDFLAFCAENNLPTVITFHTTFTGERAIRHIKRELELAAVGRVA